jgi:ribonuclease J
MDEAGKLIDEIRATVEASLERLAGEGVRDIAVLTETLHDHLAALVYDRLRRRPMVLPVVVEV